MARADPVLTFGAPGRSEGGSSAAEVGPASATGPFTVAVPFAAAGSGPLARPEASCLRHPDGYRAAPLDIGLTVDEPGRIEGTIEFPVIVPGEWSFVWACGDDHTPVPVVTTAFAALGVSTYSVDYYATVLGYAPAERGGTIRLVAHGNPAVDGDLRDPATSCLVAPSGGAVPVAAATWARAVPGVYYDGTVTFTLARPPGATFAYSCRRDYPPVALTG